MANASSPNSNGSQFFFTLDKCDWLDKKHTIFGKVKKFLFFLFCSALSNYYFLDLDHV